MPTYEYTCPDGHDFEQFVLKMSLGSAKLPCPVCGKPSERKISAGGGLVFKGSGFYITDYGKDGKKDQRTGDKSGAPAGEGGAKTESAASGGERDSPKDSSKESSKDSSKDSSKESSKDSSKESRKESPKESTKDSGKAPAAPVTTAAPAPKKKGDSS